MVAIVRRWFERLSNWQFVAVYAACNVVAFAVAWYVVSLFTQLSLRIYITIGIAVTIGNVVSQSWRRWR
jgi:hypothetical protein